MRNAPVIWILTVPRMRMDNGVESDCDPGAGLERDRSAGR